ncbi:RNA polymerase sigma factor [Fusibacter ferrireducens]|uniref:Sigma-70 family RNA polymerase sigma factor n=1 Tax=Fusibacter ferrireducens TaxID=2785058 RepID=A0ABR9ZWL7_9FIRM|nr:sigma-70 family RNA polymerase sigma factor [Fusibacter ferrireducens]MBF4694841.1 sigma-70 family RNA polymerase sigma factor [Fusibacter ferrireducens]
METKLLERAIQGDVESFEQLIKKYNRYAYNIAYRMMGNEEDAKDMSQEALIKAYKNIKKFKMESSFSTWLYRIVINTCKDELRKRKETAYSLDETFGEDNRLKHEISDEKSDPILVYEKAELKANIESALNRLSDDGKSVVVLKDILGYSYDEIGEILQIPIGTVRSRLNRSRIALKEILRVQIAES